MSDTLIRPRPSIGPTIGPGFVASGTAAQPAPALRPHRARVAPTPTPACEESTTAGISYAEPPEVPKAWEVVALVAIFAVTLLIAVGTFGRVLTL
ncbi:DUF6480 family protein [Actinacidiphila glaucinigra]|uniref:DUF6480 family protein n=1 Tax=Actinacidiphila glaucinigra TaxID=235986 RepID=UPI002DDB8252|nr:DUF6480 family protein [Actinacidiphila glaucinigra]WSD58273.1 DUF6480 family protein [Actinacidiphila glaucinigra]